MTTKPVGVKRVKYEKRKDEVCGNAGSGCTRQEILAVGGREGQEVEKKVGRKR